MDVLCTAHDATYAKKNPLVKENLCSFVGKSVMPRLFLFLSNMFPFHFFPFSLISTLSPFRSTERAETTSLTPVMPNLLALNVFVCLWIHHHYAVASQAHYRCSYMHICVG